MMKPANQQDSPIWFLYIYGGFAVVGSLIYFGQKGAIPGGLYPAMVVSVVWICLFIYHFFKKRPKKTKPPTQP